MQRNVQARLRSPSTPPSPPTRILGTGPLVNHKGETSHVHSPYTTNLLFPPTTTIRARISINRTCIHVYQVSRASYLGKVYKFWLPIPHNLCIQTYRQLRIIKYLRKTNNMRRTKFLKTFKTSIWFRYIRSPMYIMRFRRWKGERDLLLAVGAAKKAALFMRIESTF